MLPEDEKRLQREADIAKATRGPDYSRVEGEIANAKAEHASNMKAGAEAEGQRRRGLALQRWRENVTLPSPAPEPSRDKSDRDRGR